MGAPRKLLALVLLLLLFCSAPGLRGQETPGAREAARQLASAANDNAASVEERRESLRKLEEAARLFLGVDEAAEAARVLNRAGRLQLMLNVPQDALASHNRALEFLRRAPSPEAEVDGLNGLGAAYIVLKNKEQAEEVLRRAAALGRQAGYTLGQAQALLTLSDQQNSYNHPLAVRTAQEALALWQTLDDKPGLARTYTKLGQYHMAQNFLPEAAQYYERALELWRELNNPAAQAAALIMLGFIERRKGAWANAISLLSQAGDLLDERAEPFRMGQIAAGLAETFNENGLYEVGLTHYRRALDYYRLTKNPYYVAYAMWGLGVTYYLAGDYAAAAAHLQPALDGAYANDPLKGHCYEYLGRVHLATGEYDLALRDLEAALDIYTRAVNPMEAARVRGLLGQVYQQQGRLDRARRSYEKALATFTRLSDRINEGAVYYALGSLELKRGDYGAAEKHLRQSVEVTENMRRVPASSDLTAAFSATVYERYEKYIECLMRRHEAQPSRGFAARAFETSELARARSLAQLLRATQTNFLPGLDPELAAEEKALRQSLRAKEDRRVVLLAAADKGEELAELEAAIASLDARYKQVMGSIRSSHPAFEQLLQPTAWDLRRVQEQVVADDRTVLLEYMLGEEGSHVWVVTRDGFKSYGLPARGRIEEAARKVYNSLSAPPAVEGKGELSEAARELARMVLAPVAAELNGRRVIVVADGALHYVPFQVLPSPNGSGEPLVADHEIVNAPSATVLGELREEAARRRPAAKMLAAFGDPVFESDYARRKDAGGGDQQPAAPSLAMARWGQASRDIELDGDSFNPSAVQSLFYAGRELDSLRDVAAGGETFIAAEFDANRARLLGADLTGYAILHFATHGLLNPRRPEHSGLILSTVDREGRAQEGFVGLQDVYGLRAPVNLVVLSACRTGLGKDVRGEGLLGLTRGFMYAGASGVVASLWKVDDEATAELMKQFYSNMLREGMTPAAALREAQNGIRRRPHWRAPYYWAAFTLQGESRPIDKPARAAGAASPYAKVAAVVSLSLLLASAAWWYARRRTRAASARA